MSTVDVQVTVKLRGRAKLPVEAATPRMPRITRLMALAIKFQEMVDRGEVRDYADLARLGYVTRARITQIMNLLLLAPDIQETLLLPSPTRLPPTEKQIRSAARNPFWKAQRLSLGLIDYSPPQANFDSR